MSATLSRRFQFGFPAIVVVCGLAGQALANVGCPSSGLLQFDPADRIRIDGVGGDVYAHASDGGCGVISALPCCQTSCGTFNTRSDPLVPCVHPAARCGGAVNKSVLSCRVESSYVDPPPRSNAASYVSSSLSASAEGEATDSRVYAGFSSIADFQGWAKIEDCEEDPAAARGYASARTNQVTVTIPFTVCEPGFYLVDAILQSLGTCGSDDGFLGWSSVMIDGTWKILGGPSGSQTIVAGTLGTDVNGSPVLRNLRTGPIQAGGYTFVATYEMDTEFCLAASCPTSSNDGLCQALGTYNANIWFSAAEFEDPCPGDLNDDGVVDALDHQELFAQWGACPSGSGAPPCTADLSGDGVVDVNDLLLLNSNWGDCPPTTLP